MGDNETIFFIARNTTSNGGNTTEESHTSLQVSMFQLKIIYYTIGTVGILGNFLVLYVISRSPDMRRRITNMYITNQSVADFLGSVFLVLTSLFQEPERKLHGLADETYCYIWLTKWPMWATFMASTYSLILITIERYLSVVHVVWHKTSFTKTKAIVSIISIWLMAGFYIGSYLLIPTKLVNGYCSLFNHYISPEAFNGTGIMNVSMLYFIPIFILMFCYCRMAMVLHRRVQPAAASGQPGGQHAGHMNRAKKNVIKTLMVVSLGFILCWTCNQVYFLLFTLGYPADFTSTFYHTTVVMVFCNCCVNPFIYMFKYDIFKKNARRLFPWFFKQRVGGEGPSSGTRAQRTLTTVNM